jgi:ribonuclease P protein component
VSAAGVSLPGANTSLEGADTPLSGAGNPRGKRLYRFWERERIKKGTEIRRLIKECRSVGCRGLKLSWERTESGTARMAIALRRGYGNAVERNRAKRLIRENFRLLKPEIPVGCNLVFTVFPGPDDFKERGGQMSRLFAEAGLIDRKKR